MKTMGMLRGVVLGALALHAGAGWAEAPTVVYAAGDIAQCGLPGAKLTAQLVSEPAAQVLAVGDLAYPKGRAEDFTRCYEPTWGRFKARTLPVPGNHEYMTSGAAPYFSYFGMRAMPFRGGYYSTDLGAWHVVALNSNIDIQPGSAQMAWLADDLAQHRQRCTLAFWHHPRFSSGRHGDNREMQPLWAMLQHHGVSIAINGHDHDYERFAPLDADGKPDPRGLRSFVVGSGGSALYQGRRDHANSEKWNETQWGVLRLELYPDRYSWKFLTEDGAVSDQGSGTCAGPVGTGK